MKKSKILGYVVWHMYGNKGLGEDNVLWIGDVATLFATRRRAKNAITRTEAYGAKINGRCLDAWTGHYVMTVRGEK